MHFVLRERGKQRPIDAPLIRDRQIHKAYSRKVLLPLYTPSMIYNNGASLPQRGFAFSRKQLRRELAAHYRRYQDGGWVILLDFTQFFPNASHEVIQKRHARYILNEDLRQLGDRIVASSGTQKGVPLGVEPSQAEMVAYPSALDNYIKCQLSLKGAGHYMDDYYILVPPDRDPKVILEQIIAKAETLELKVNHSKTRIMALKKPFKFCKITYFFNARGRIITRGSRESLKRARRKFRSDAFAQMPRRYLWDAVRGVLQYFAQFNDHNRILFVRRLFFSLFGFSCELFENFIR